MAKKLKIGVVAFPSYGGSGAVATELGKFMAKRGHTVHFITTEIPFRLIGPWKKNIFYHEVELLEYPVLKSSPYTLTLANKIYEVAQLEDLDLIHVHYALPHLNAALIARDMIKKKFKVICTLHGTDVTITGSDPIIRDVMGYALGKADAITAIAKELRDEAVEHFSLKPKPEVIYNFVEVVPYDRKKAEELHGVFANKEQKIIIHVSNFRSVKRVQDVVKIFAGIRKKISSKLLLVGDGPDQRVAHRMAAKLNVIPDIHFMGLQSQVSRLLSIADLFLLPSKREGLSLAALEAMTLGIPVIATNVGGMPELITHEENGFLSSVGDIDSMVKSSVKVLSDDEFYKQISIAAQKTITKKFSPDLIIPQYEELYYKVLK